MYIIKGSGCQFGLTCPLPNQYCRKI